MVKLVIEYVNDFGQVGTKEYEVPDNSDHYRRLVGAEFRKEYPELRKQKLDGDLEH